MVVDAAIDGKLHLSLKHTGNRFGAHGTRVCNEKSNDNARRAPPVQPAGGRNMSTRPRAHNGACDDCEHNSSHFLCNKAYTLGCGWRVLA